MRARAATSELDPGLRLYARRKMMLDQCHLGDEVGGSDQLRLGIAAGNNDVQIGATAGERGHDSMKIEVLVGARRC